MNISPSERRALARLLGLNEQYLYQCLTGRASMDPKEACRAERKTKGRITRKMLRVHDWREIWPELVKRKSKTEHS